jgi:hypothetical protein
MRAALLFSLLHFCSRTETDTGYYKQSINWRLCFDCGLVLIRKKGYLRGLISDIFVTTSTDSVASITRLTLSSSTALRSHDLAAAVEGIVAKRKASDIDVQNGN